MSQDAIAILQMRENIMISQMRVESGYILKVKQTNFADILNACYERKREIKEATKALARDNGRI